MVHGASDRLAAQPRGDVVRPKAQKGLAAGEIAGRETLVLLGGTRAWQAAGYALESGATALADEPIDVWYRPYDFKDNVEAAMRQYLDWEVDLVPQVERDGDARFKVLKR